MTPEGTLILNATKTKQKIVRIAHEILEDNYDEQELFLAGIYDRGYVFAQLLKAELEKICTIKIELIKVELDKKAPLQTEIKLDKPVSIVENKTVIITDDVLNTGRTIAYSLKPFLTHRIKKLQTAFVVDRNHKSFPISADFVGYGLSTTLQEHINVVLEDEENFGVYLH